MIDPSVGDPVLNGRLALLTFAIVLTIAAARRRAPLWPAVLLAVLAELVELFTRAG